MVEGKEKETEYGCDEEHEEPDGEDCSREVFEAGDYYWEDEDEEYYYDQIYDEGYEDVEFYVDDEYYV